MNKKFIFPLVFVIFLWVLVPVYAAQPPVAPGREVLALPKSDIVPCSTAGTLSVCLDNTCSTSTSPGTCSGHGGVVGTLFNPSGVPVEVHISVSGSASSGSGEGRPQYTLAPTIPSDPYQPLGPAPVSSPQSTLNQPALTQIPASGGILANQSVPLHLTSAISVLLVMAVMAVKAVSKK